MAKLPANADPLEATSMVAAFAASSTGTASLQSDFPDSSAGGAATPEQGRDREHGHSLDNSPHSQLLPESEEQSPADSGGRPMVRSTFLRVCACRCCQVHRARWPACMRLTRWRHAARVANSAPQTSVTTMQFPTAQTW